MLLLIKINKLTMNNNNNNNNIDREAGDHANVRIELDGLPNAPHHMLGDIYAQRHLQQRNLNRDPETGEPIHTQNTGQGPGQQR